MNSKIWVDAQHEYILSYDQHICILLQNFISATNKGSIGTSFQQGLKIIHRQIITSSEAIVTEKSFISNANLYFFH